MNNSLKIALLAASGVSETEMTAIQRALGGAKMRASVVSPESGLIHSWGEGTWGHCYPADAKLEVSLGSDYDMLIVPGGERHVTKLMSNPHTKRFVSAFFLTNKPVAVFSDAQTILATHELSGDNACRLNHATGEELTDAAAKMMVHFENFASDLMAQAA